MLQFLRLRALPAIIEWCLWIPIWFPLSILMIPNTQLSLWIGHMSAAVFSGVIMTWLYPFRKRWQSSAFSAAIGITSVFIWFFTFNVESYGQHAIIFAFTSLLAYRGTLYGMRRWYELLNSMMVIGSLMLFFVMSLFFKYYEPLQSYANFFTFTGVVVLAIVLVLMNVSHLQAAALTQESEDVKAIRPILKVNRLYLAVLFLLIMGISFYDTLWKLALQSLQAWLSRLRFPTGEDEIEPVPPMDNTMQNLIPMDDNEPSRLAMLLERIFMWVAFIVAFVVGIGLLILAVRHGMKFLRKLFGFMNSISSESDSTGYVDIKESLLNNTKTERRNKWRKMWEHWRHQEPKWQDLRNNRERARYLYKHWILEMIRRGYTWKPYYTPSETTSDTSHWLKEQENAKATGIATVYQKARYGKPDQEPTDEEITAMHKKVLGKGNTLK